MACIERLRNILAERNGYSRIPALREFPTIRVVHPAYHCLPNGGHGSFFASGNLRLSCDRVFATEIWTVNGRGTKFKKGLSPYTLRDM